MEQRTTAEIELQDTTFVIAGWSVDPATLRIALDGEEVKLEPKVMAVLEYLASKPGEVVSRQELEEQVWTGTVVGYDAISNAIIKLRKAFGDDAHNPQIIETIPKTGYRLIAPVERSHPDVSDAVAVESRETLNESVSADQSSDPVSPIPAWKLTFAIGMPLLMLVIVVLLFFKPWVARVEAASIENFQYQLPDRPSVVVLPIENMSPDPQQEYFVDGITVDLITELSKNSKLFVVAYNSVRSYKQTEYRIRDVAEALGVQYVVEGRVRRDDQQIRVNVELIDALAGEQIWADKFDGVLQGVFELQDEISTAIVDKLEVSLGIDGREQVQQTRLVDVEAYDLYQKGLGHHRAGSPRDYARAVEYYRQALSIEPDLARARASLAAALFEIHQNRWWVSLDIADYRSFDQARQALEHSKLMPVALTYQVASEFHAYYDGNARRALLEADKAISLNPNDPAGHVALAYARLKDGNLGEAEAAIRSAMRLDPHYPPKYLFRLGQIQFHREQYTEAIESLQQAVTRNPEDDWMQLYLAASYGKLEKVDEGLAALARADELRARNGWGPLTLLALSNGFWGWIGDVGKLKDGLRAIGAPVGGEWYRLISPQKDYEPPQVEGATMIDVAEAHAMHQRGVVFIDVSFQWIQHRIPRAVLLELWHGEGYRFNENSLRRHADFDDEIVVYSSKSQSQHLGRRTAMAAAIAVSRGFKRIYHFPGGLDAWKAAGHPVERPG